VAQGGTKSIYLTKKSMYIVLVIVFHKCFKKEPTSVKMNVFKNSSRFTPKSFKMNGFGVNPKQVKMNGSKN